MYSAHKSSNDLSLNALPLGIAGDRTVDLLWRIRNGEMPEELNPSIWWILIGTVTQTSPSSHITAAFYYES